MIIPLSAVLGLLLPAALGGDLRRLGGVRLSSVRLVLAAFLAQLLAISVLDGPVVVLEAVHIASYVVAAYVLWVNRRLPGLPILGAGALANGVTIALNGGTLPARAGALRTAGLTDDAGFVNSGVLEHPRLAFLGDIFAVPAGTPLANVFSIGDVLIVLGATWASVAICGTRWSEPWAVTRRHAPPDARLELPAAAVPGAVDVLPGATATPPAPAPAAAAPAAPVPAAIPQQRRPRHVAGPALRIPAPRRSRRTAPRGRRALRPSSPGEVRDSA